MEIILILFYTSLCSLWIMKGRFWGRSRLKREVLVFVFLLKVVLGIVYGLAYYEYYKTGDIVHYFRDSQLIYSTLPEHPGHFLELTFGYSKSGAVPEHLEYIYDQMRLSWRTQEYTPVRINSIFNLLSFGHYYVNVVFMALISLSGLVLLHESFRKAFPDKSAGLALSIFFIPSTLFWCSGIHKDGITLFAAAVLIHATGELARNPRSRQLFIAAAAAFLLWNTRAYTLLILLPNLLLYFWCLRRPGKNWLRFGLVNLLLVVAFANAHHIVPRMNFMAKLAFEQEFLLHLRGNTHLEMRPIGDTVWSLASNIPSALDHIFLKPITHRPQNAFQWIAAIDNGLQILLLLALMLMIRPSRSISHPLLILSLFFTGTLLVLIGMTVPALGAIVRYKSVALPFLFSVAVVLTDSGKWPAFLSDGSRLLRNSNNL